LAVELVSASSKSKPSDEQTDVKQSGTSESFTG
jgi:hypothetical protein